MTAIKPSSHGIVVDHVESGVRYAISDKNYNVKLHRKVRDLKPGETVRGFQPLRRGSLSDAVGDQDGTGTPESAGKSEGDGSEGLAESQGSGRKATQTEGAAPAASQEKKEGN